MEWRCVMVLPRVVRYSLVESALLVFLFAEVEDPVLAWVELVQEALDLLGEDKIE